jgi:hypothetical protein
VPPCLLNRGDDEDRENRQQKQRRWLADEAFSGKDDEYQRRHQAEGEVAVKQAAPADDLDRNQNRRHAEDQQKIHDVRADRVAEAEATASTQGRHDRNRELGHRGAEAHHRQAHDHRRDAELESDA